jgi:uncharacterized protein YggE
MRYNFYSLDRGSLSNHDSVISHIIMPAVKVETASAVKSRGIGCDGCCSSSGPHGASKKIFWVAMCALLIFGFFCVDALTQYLRVKTSYVGKGERLVPTITVAGYGKVTGRNDIAVTTIGFTNTDKDVATAQTNNKKVMDQVMADLKKLGIEERDLQTNYSIYPDYDYTNNKNELKGYKVSQSVTVKVRNLQSIPNVLALAGKYGANEVGGLSFTIDDTESLRNESRQKALEDAKMKAQKLAASLGMRLVEIVNYGEYQGGGYDAYGLKNEASNMSAGMGIGGISTPVPVSSGSTDVEMNVNLTYEIAR